MAGEQSNQEQEATHARHFQSHPSGGACLRAHLDTAPDSTGMAERRSPIRRVCGRNTTPAGSETGAPGAVSKCPPCLLRSCLGRRDRLRLGPFLCIDSSRLPRCSMARFPGVPSSGCRIRRWSARRNCCWCGRRFRRARRTTSTVIRGARRSST